MPPFIISARLSGKGNGVPYIETAQNRRSRVLKPPTLPVPPVPTGLIASASSDTQVDLACNTSRGATGYTFLISANNGSSWSNLVTQSGTTYSATGLNQNSPYLFAVKANGGMGSSAQSASVSATTLPETQQLAYLDGNSNPITPVSGTYDLVFGGQTTSDISYNATSADLLSALEALGSIGTGNIATFGLQVGFIGTLSGSTQSLLTVANNSLVGLDNTISVTTTTAGAILADPTVAELVVGQTGSQRSWLLVFQAGNGSTQFQLTDGTLNTADLDDNCLASDIQTALNAILITDGYDAVAVTDSTGSSSGSVQPFVVVDSTPVNPPAITRAGGIAVLAVATVGGVPEVQTLTLPGIPSGAVGGFTLTLFPQSGTITIGESVSGTIAAADIAAAYASLFSETFGVYALNGSTAQNGGPFLVVGSVAGTPGVPSVSLNTMGVYQVDTITLDVNVSGGTARLSSDTFAWNDTGAGVQTAYSDWATANSYSAATIVQTSSSPNTFTVAYSTIGDQSAVTAAMLAALNTGSNALTQPVTVSVTAIHTGLPTTTCMFRPGPSWCFSDSLGTVPCTNGAAVAVWKDITGTYSVVPSGAGGITLTIDTDNLPAVQFDGSEYLTGTIGFDNSADYSVIAVARQTTTEALLLSGPSVGVSFGCVGGSAPTFWAGYSYPGDGHTYPAVSPSYDDLSDTSAPDSTATILMTAVVSTGGNTFLGYSANTSIGTDTVPSGSYGPTLTFGNYNGSSLFPLVGMVKQVLLQSSQLSDADRTAANVVLGSEYGVTVSTGPTAPATPSGLAANTEAAPNGDNEVDLSWSASSGSVTGYYGQWSLDDATWNSVGPTASLGITVTGLPNNTLIYFQVQAYGPGGSSSWSSSVTATTLADEIQQIQYVDANSNPITPDSGTYQLVFGGDTTTNIGYAAADSDIGTALNALASINGDAGVTGTSPTFTCQFIGDLGGAPQSLLTVVGNTLVAADNTISVTTISPFGDTSVTLSVSEITAGVNSTQTSMIIDASSCSIGSYYVQGSPTSYSPDNPYAIVVTGGTDPAAASGPQSAMDSAFGAGAATATSYDGVTPDKWLIVFNGSNGTAPFYGGDPQVTTNTTDGTPTVTGTNGVAGIQEVMQITCTPAPNIGQYNLGSDLLNFDDSTGAGVVACQTAINDLLGSGIATVSSGPLSSGAFTVTWNSPGVPALKLSDATSNFGTPNVVNSTMQTDVNQVDQIQLDANVSGGTATLGSDTFPWNDTGSGVQTAYNDFATANSYSAATIVQTSSSPNTFSIAYATPGDQTTVTAALLAALNTSNALTQAVTVSVTETQAGG